jgi:FkbM family methyltransferase
VIIYLASYPRSGNTLARQLIWHYWGRLSASVYSELTEPKDFPGEKTVEPDADPRFNRVVMPGEAPYRILADDMQLFLTPEFRKALAEDEEIYFLKTHELPFEDYFEGEYVLRIVRHPGAALWSFYHYLAQIVRTPTPLEAVIPGIVNSVGGSWSQYTDAWLKAEEILQDRSVKIKYEELVHNDGKLIASLQNWIKLPLRQPIDTFPGFQYWNQLSPEFYRSGQIDEWQNKLTSEQLILLYQHHAEAAAKEGYTFDFPPPPFAADYETRIHLARLGMADAKPLRKVENAGQVVESGPLRYQVMFNGVKVPADSYYGPWYSELIRQCHGHHEPQEEYAFDALVNRAPEGAVMMELGSYWAFYSTWFLTHVPRSRAILAEPDPLNIPVSLATLSLNNCHAVVEFCAVGERVDGSELMPIGGATTENFLPPLRQVDELLQAHGVDHLYILHSDIQGAELAMLEGAAEALLNRQIDYVVISTHSNTLHHACLRKLSAAGYRIMAEHDLFESYTYDGLIVACSDRVSDPPTVKIHKRTVLDWKWEQAASAWARHSEYLEQHLAMQENQLSWPLFKRLKGERLALLQERQALTDELAQAQPLLDHYESLSHENSELKAALEQLRHDNSALQESVIALQQESENQLQYVRSRKIARIMKILGKPLI